jgi:hypothetical protein
MRRPVTPERHQLALAQGACVTTLSLVLAVQVGAALQLAGPGGAVSTFNFASLAMDLTAVVLMCLLLPGIITAAIEAATVVIEQGAQTREGIVERAWDKLKEWWQREPEEPRPAPCIPYLMACTPDEDDGDLLYHYTSATNLAKIMACSCMVPSTSEDPHAAYGPGVYWTDITPGQAAGVTRGQFSVALTTTPFGGWNGKFDFFVEVDVASLVVPPERVDPTFGDRFPGNSVFLSRTSTRFPIRIRSSGAVRWGQ